MQDIYKGCFQDYFGPAHILTDTASVKRYITQELEQLPAQVSSDIYYEPCSWRENYYRVNLSVIKDGYISIDDFTRAFMESAGKAAPELTREWIDEWATVMQAVRETATGIECFEADSAMITDMLQQGKYVVHHSAQFNENYRPHYRIISKEIFNRCIRPYLPD